MLIDIEDIGSSANHDTSSNFILEEDMIESNIFMDSTLTHVTTNEREEKRENEYYRNRK